MNFLYPEFLWALFSLLVPVIIHLFHFRRFKKVYFTNVRFLKQLKNESESTSKIKNLLILISRLLALTCLVFVFAQPFIRKNKSNTKTGSKAVSIFIDNSFSMEAENKNGMLFEQSKNKAREIVKAFKDDDKFQLLTNDFEGRHQHLLTKEEFMQALDELKISSSSKKISEIYSRQRDLLLNSNFPVKQNFIISDFQEKNFDFNDIKKDTALQTYLLPIQSTQQNNVFIDSCWFDTPVQHAGMSQKLNVSIVNQSQNQLVNATLKLFSNNKLIAPVTFSSEPNSKVIVPVSFLPKETGFQQCRLEIEDAPVTFDNELFFSFEIKSKIKTIVVNGKTSKSSGYFNSLMKNDSLFNYYEFSDDGIAFNEFKSADFVILNNLKSLTSGLISELTTFSKQGGSILMFPSVDAELNSYNELFKNIGANNFTRLDTVNTKVEKVNYAQGLYEGVFEKKQENMDLPKTFSHFQTSRTIINNEDVILSLMNGDNFLVQYSLLNAAKFYVCYSSLEPDASNFGKHALFVPTIIKMAINSSFLKPLFFNTGKNEQLLLKNSSQENESVFHIVDENKTLDIIPEVKKEITGFTIFTQSQINKHGNYFIKNNSEIIDVVSFNYSRNESVLKLVSIDLIEEKIGENNSSISLVDSSKQTMDKFINKESDGILLWKLFLVLTIVFIIIEILLIRFYK